MAVKKGGPKHKRQLTHAVRSKTRRLRADDLATPSANISNSKRAANQPQPHASNQRFADDLVADSASDNADKLPSVMLVITLLAVVYIAFLTWQVAQMPAK